MNYRYGMVSLLDVGIGTQLFSLNSTGTLAYKYLVAILCLMKHDLACFKVCLF